MGATASFFPEVNQVHFRILCGEERERGFVKRFSENPAAVRGHHECRGCPPLGLGRPPIRVVLGRWRGCRWRITTKRAPWSEGAAPDYDDDENKDDDFAECGWT